MIVKALPLTPCMPTYKNDFLNLLVLNETFKMYFKFEIRVVISWLWWKGWKGVESRAYVVVRLEMR